MKNLCIAYVTKTNTTKEIAEEIGKIAREKDWKVKILPLTAVADLREYDAVLIGAPINGMQWLPEANEFVEKHQEVLNERPTSFFLVSYLMNSGAMRWRKLIDKSLNKASNIVAPFSIGKFDGRVEDEFGAIPRFLFGLKKGTPLDLRNWDQIRGWANDYIDTLNVTAN